MANRLEKVAIIGTGTLGTQIAMLAANAGYQVKAFDVRKGIFQNTLETSKGIDLLIPADRWPACLKNIQQVPDLEKAVRQAELIIEAVPENPALKCKMWQEIGHKSSPEAIMATNSSSIPVSRLEESSGRPERCLNLHFYLGMKMADVMEGSKTHPEVTEKGADWIRSLGLIPLTVKKEILGFCFNRVWRAVKKEVLYMWANGFVDFRDVDRAWMIFNGIKGGPGAFGPFIFMDRIGLDVIYDIEMVYYRDSGDPKDNPPQALKDKIDRGELGIKSGKGFYSYPYPEYLRDDFLNP